jgi:hypothetical protein
VGNAQAAHTGNYDVVVSNVVGSATSAAASLSLNVPVSITTQPAAVAVNPGGLTTLSVKATGTAPLGYQWFRNGEPLAGATSASLPIGPAQDADAGNYHVAVSNVVGTVASVAVALTINTPPAVVLDPVSLSLSAGSLASFSVSATGTAPLTYQWRRNGAPIAGATSANYSIGSAQASHAASYDVVVSNVAGSVTSAPATLAINRPLSFTTQPAGVVLNPGASASLSVVVEGTAPIVYQWRRNGTAISGATNPSYSIGPVSEGDAAAYDVVVSNVVGSVVSERALVTLNVPVNIIRQPVGVSLNPASMTTLTVAATGTGPLSYQWSKDGMPIPGANATSLVLSNAQAVDAGTYAVVVGNVVGSVSSEGARVSINTPVSISAQPEGVQITAGSAVLLSVTATGTEPLSYQWFKNGAALPGANTNTYAIASATAGDAATYEVAVSNVVGTVNSAQAVVGLNVPVSITSQPASFTTVKGTSMSLSVAVAGTAPFSYQWRKSGVEIAGQTASSLTLNPVQLSDAGAYDVVVGNVVGRVTSATALVTVQDPPEITTPITGGTVKAGTSYTFRTTVAGTGPFSYQWRKDGIPIAGATAISYSIPMVDESFAGLYDIVVTGPSGSVVSPGATLSVLSISSGPPVFMTQPVNVAVAWGKSATVSAMVAATKPFSYEWYKVGAPEAGVPDVLVDSGSSPAVTGLVLRYTVAAVKEASEGLYELRLRDFAGNPAGTLPAVIRLNLSLGDARLLLRGWRQDISNLQSDSLATVVLPSGVAANEMLSVGLRTSAPATYSWIHRTGIGTVTKLSGQTSPTLNFKDVVRLRGFYVLTVSTGGTNRNITFQVLSFATTNLATGGVAAPSVSNPKSVAVPVGWSAAFGVSTTGGVRGYTWWKQQDGLVDKALTGVEASPFLIIDNVSLADDGTRYYVEVFSADPSGASVKSLPASLDVVPSGD